MQEFGKYTLKYKPPKGAAETKVKMEITSEVAIPELLVFFEDFMRAAGYILDGKRLSLEEDAPDFSFLDGISDFGTSHPGPAWADSGASYWGGYPRGGIAYKGAEGAQATGVQHGE
jgi:hypothetical protein